MVKIVTIFADNGKINIDDMIGTRYEAYEAGYNEHDAL